MASKTTTGKTAHNNTKHTHRTSKQIALEATGISEPTRKWIVGLAMVQDIRDYIRLTESELKEMGYPVKDHDDEMLEATKKLQAVINKYLTNQINMSILGIGTDNLCDTARL